MGAVVTVAPASWRALLLYFDLTVFISCIEIVVAAVIMVVYQLFYAYYALADAGYTRSRLEYRAGRVALRYGLVSKRRRLVSPVSKQVVGLLRRQALHEPVRVKRRIACHCKHLAASRIHNDYCSRGSKVYVFALIFLFLFRLFRVISYKLLFLPPHFCYKVCKRRLTLCLKVNFHRQHNVVPVLRRCGGKLPCYAQVLVYFNLS